jgi:hypothetical protein
MNPNDVFPRRNLPGESEAWGREVEDRIRNIEYGVLGQKTNLKSDNRALSSNMQEISRQLVQLRANQAALDAAVRAIPKTFQSTASTANFGLSSGWNTVASTSVTVPDGTNTARLLVIGSGQIVTTTTTGNVESVYRANIPGVGASPDAPGPWTTGYGDFRTVLTPSYGWTVSATPGQVITAEFQVNPEDASSYPPNGNTYAVITLLATFTG